MRDALRKKRIVLFGSTHNSKETQDSEIFISLIPELKRAGFTHIGMELDQERHQQTVNQYLEDGDERKISKQLGVYIDGAKLLSIIRAKRTVGNFKVICYDDRQPKHFRVSESEDRQQWWGEREQHGFDKIEETLKSQSTKIAIYCNKVHIANSEVSTFQFGKKKNGQPVLIRLQPLGYRLIQKYKKFGVGIINLSGAVPTEAR